MNLIEEVVLIWGKGHINPNVDLFFLIHDNDNTFSTLPCRYGICGPRQLFEFSEGYESTIKLLWGGIPKVVHVAGLLCTTYRTGANSFRRILLKRVLTSNREISLTRSLICVICNAAKPQGFIPLNGFKSMATLRAIP